MMIKKIIPLVLLLLFLSNQLIAGNQSLTRLNDISVKNFNLPDIDGENYTLTDFRGQPVIINFWATWCPPCRRELPSMNRAWQKIKNQGIHMIAINVGEDEDTIFSFTGDYPIDFLTLLDLDGSTVKAWPVKGLPTTFVLDPQGRIVYQAVGEREWDDEALLDKVRALRTKP